MNMIIDSDGLPREPMGPEPALENVTEARRSVILRRKEGRKDVATEAIVAMLRTGKIIYPY